MERGKDILKELKEQAPGLVDISNEVPYKVPEGYFENLVIPPHPNQAVVKSIYPVRKIFRYAAAAVIISLITLTVWYFSGTSLQTEKPLLAQTNDSSTEIKADYLLSAINDIDIEEYIESDMPALPEDINTAEAEMQDMDIHFLFEEVSDQELENFLNSPV